MRMTHLIIKLKRVSLALLALLMAGLIASLPGASSAASAATATPAKTGVVCTYGTSFTLTAKKGYISLPDGNTSFMWSYALGNGAFQMPGPVLCVNEGATVTITLNNTLPEDTSLAIPGLDNVLANGAASQPQFNGTGDLTSLAQVAAKTSGTMVYSFVASQPGTYVYESGTDQAKQIQMGLFGALIVKAKAAGLPGLLAGGAYAYNRADSAYNNDKEYLMITSELDPDLHQAVERSYPYDITKYHPRYWQINGRSFPDTIADNNTSWLPNQPYGSMVQIQPTDATANPYPALVRYINVGMLNHPFHPHGNHGRVIGRDGRALASPAGEDLSYEKYLIMLGAGQTWDVTYKWTDVTGWNPTTNPIPVTLPQQQDLTYKGGITWYSGSPYLGYQDDLPTGTTSYNQCGEYYQVWHSHALNEAANYDLGFGGMFTLQRIDPPTALQNQTGRKCS